MHINRLGDYRDPWGRRGKRTWTGLSFQVGDLFEAVVAVGAAGGDILREPEDTPGEPADLAMWADTEGNEFMLTRKRHSYSSKQWKGLSPKFRR